MQIFRNEIWIVDFGTQQDKSGSVQYGLRPCIVVCNNVGLKHSQIAIVAPISSAKKHDIPTHVKIGKESGLMKDSVILCEQLYTMAEYDFVRKIGELVDCKLLNVALKVSLDLD